MLEKGDFYVRREEKKYQDFINKFTRSVAELEIDFAELSENDKSRVAIELLGFVRQQTVLKMAISAISGRYNKGSY